MASLRARARSAGWEGAAYSLPEEASRRVPFARRLGRSNAGKAGGSDVGTLSGAVGTSDGAGDQRGRREHMCERARAAAVRVSDDLDRK